MQITPLRRALSLRRQLCRGMATNPSVFFDIAIGDDKAGRIEFELFAVLTQEVLE